LPGNTLLAVLILQAVIARNPDSELEKKKEIKRIVRNWEIGNLAR
jgi:hypothetical protein